MRTKHIRFLLSLLLIPALAGCPGDDTTETGSSSADDDDDSSTGEDTVDPVTTMPTASTTTTTATTSTTSSGSDSSGDPTTTTSASSGEEMTSSSGSTSTATSTGSDSSSGSSSSTGTPDEDVECVGADGGDVCSNPSPYTGGGECDPFAQDECPAGQRCVPWANDGGNAWNSTRCSPIDAMPGQVGDACTVEGSGVSGIDSCDIGTMCWDVDGETNVGTCIELCGCGPLEPTCQGMNSACVVSNDGSLPICLPTCDPLLNDECPDGQGCYFTGDFFTCAPDASGELGTAGDPCEFINACDPGHHCVSSAAVPGCAGSSGCCTEFCDVDEGDGACSVAGTSCIGIYEEGAEPEECHVDSGICVTPA